MKITSKHIRGYVWFITKNNKQINITYDIADLLGEETIQTIPSYEIFEAASSICDSKDGSDVYALEVDENGDVYTCD